MELMVSFPIIVDTKIIFIGIVHTTEIFTNVSNAKRVYKQVYNFNTKGYNYVIYHSHNIIHSTKVFSINQIAANRTVNNHYLLV